MYCTTISVAVPGPPPVSTKTSSKVCAPLISASTITTIMLGHSSGSVIRVSTRQLGGLVEIGGDRLQTGEQDQGVDAHIRPHRDEHRPEHRPARIDEEQDLLTAERGDRGIEQPVAPQDPFP